MRTHEVRVGSIGIGGDNPIRLQSMTTTDTMDTEATVEQSIRMIEAGCELVRVTAPSKRDAENLAQIKAALRERGYDTPLVADIHFTPNAAEIAARIVEKVRVNPGNYADKKKFESHTYTEDTYKAELDRIRERFTPLVRICKEEDIAIRIGTNHGSLSDRILSHYGDTPLGMVESAMEFLRICQSEEYDQVVLSMKASNVQVMVQAYRLLAAHMDKEGMDFPLHLGVTEAGEGEDGRIKSAVGIGTLLEDGLGDTIRVSLTEEPEAEIPVARILAERYTGRTGEPIAAVEEIPIDPFSYHRRPSRAVMNIGGEHVPVVFADLSSRETIEASSLFPLGYHYLPKEDKWKIGDQAIDYLFAGDHQIAFEIPGTLGIVQPLSVWRKDKDRHFPLIETEDLRSGTSIHPELNFLIWNASKSSWSDLSLLKGRNDVVLVLRTDNSHGMAEQRRFFFELMRRNVEVPVIIQRSYSIVDQEQLTMYASTDLGALLVDGLGDGVWIDQDGIAHAGDVNRLGFGILQATRTRISKTEYISCPSCGRTLFDLQETTGRIRAATDHLKGVKIGVMGCIVNGPGEMADADYGYVGTGPGKITLYLKQEVVKRNIPEEEALDELIELIRSHGDWVPREV
jgi:(E)-4-hydroxy-3-methylbut-2-enyl-diphosphate synthase